MNSLSEHFSFLTHGDNLQFCSPWQALATISLFKRSLPCDRAKKWHKVLTSLKFEVLFCLGPLIEKTNSGLFMSNMNNQPRILHSLNVERKWSRALLFVWWSWTFKIRILFNYCGWFFVLKYVRFCNILASLLWNVGCGGKKIVDKKVSHLTMKSVAN